MKSHKDQIQKQEFQKINRGQYELHVLIQATSALSLSSDSTIDVKVAVTAFGKTEYTKVKSKIGIQQTFWGEHLYFVKNFDSSFNGQNQRLLIEVYDYNKLLANSLVGSYQLDVQRIYSYNNHTIKHTWLALSNNDRNFSQITGYVKISASVLGEKDQNVELDVQPISSITKQKNILAPPEIQRKIYQIKAEIIQGKYIRPADGTTVDSYIGVEFGQIFSVSQTIMKDTSPKYNTRVYIPMSLPAAIENIAFRLHDYNYIKKTEVLGSFYLNINQLVKSTESSYRKSKNDKNLRPIQYNQRPPINQFQWVNFYGPQNDTSRQDQKNIQQFFPNVAPFYVGSVLMRVLVSQATTLVQTKKQTIGVGQIKQAVQVLRAPVRFFKINAKITGALGLFYKNQKHKISVKIGAEQFFTNQSLAKNGFCLWNIEKVYTFKINSMQTIPDIFVYLLDQKNNRICYKRYKPVLGTVVEDRWEKLIPDSAMIKMNNSQAGYIKIGLNISSTDKLQQVKDIKIQNNLLGPTYLNNGRSGRIVVDLLCGSQLLPLDQDGSIDAFFNFSYLNSEVTSPVISQTINPNYYQRLVIETDVLSEQDSPPIIVRAYDKDKLSNQFLGQAFIDIGDAIKNKSLVYGLNQSPTAVWYQLHQDDLVTGKFLCMFTFLPKYTANIPRQIKIQPKNYQITLVILGLRGLRNSGVISVKQPFIQFDIGSLDFQNKLTKQIRQSKMVKTQPREKGRSVNINSVIPTKVSLPSNVSYWPTLTGKVRDNVIQKVYQPTLGYFSINLSKAYKRSAEIRQKFQNQRKTLLQIKSKIVGKPPRLGNISDNVLLSLRNFILKSINYNWKTIDSSIQNSLNSLKKKPKQPINQDYIIIFPNYEKQVQGKNSNLTDNQNAKYVQKYRDIIQKNKQYMQIGFDDTKTRSLTADKRNKHYRFCLQQPYQSYYERVYGVKMGIMEQIPIRIGSYVLDDDLSSTFLRKMSKEDMIAGTFKGQIFISQYDDKIVNQQIQFKKKSQQLLQLLLKKGKVHMYLYVLQAANLPQKDEFSASDPYLVVKSGQQKQEFKSQYIENQSNPQFLKKVKMILSFPEDSSIDIQIWDYDPVGADQLIGYATIDIQNRIQAKMTSNKFNNPVQTHNLYHSTSKRPQGLVRFWLDLVPADNVSLYRQFNISNRSKTNLQLRVIVWQVDGMPNQDIEDMSDLYVDCTFNGVTQSSDVHYRSSNGTGFFNWRMVYPIAVPVKDTYLNFKVFDRDMLNSNDYLASSQIDLKQYIENVYESDTSQVLYLGQTDFSLTSEVKTGKKKVINGRDRYDRFQLKAYNKLSTQEGGKLNRLNDEGTIQVSIQILTEQQAKRRPAGKGRQNPNQHPFLPEPKGRFQFSMNPIKLLGQLFGPKCKRYGCLIIVLVICVVLFIYLILPFSGSILGSMIGSRN